MHVKNRNCENFTVKISPIKKCFVFTKFNIISREAM